MNASKIVVLTAVAAVSTAFADTMDRSGIKIGSGQRMTLRPYVSLSYTYDSNVDSSKHGQDGSQWVVNPGLVLEYKDDNWDVTATAYYNYHAYNRYTSQLNSSSYGQTLDFKWVDAARDERGWLFQMEESFRQVAQDDDMSNSKGRGIGRDRKEFKVNGILQRRVNQYLFATALAGFYLLDYDNDVSKYARLYGWKSTVVGGELGYIATKWTSFLVHGDYQWYWQDNTDNTGIGDTSRGYTIQAGLCSYATERIEYRLLGGWSYFDFGNGTHTLDGFTYKASAKYKVGDHLDLVAFGSSYFQPSEYNLGTAMKVNTFSVGLQERFVDNLRGTLDLAYRNESYEYSTSGARYDTDIWTGRVGLTYKLNRFVHLFGRVEYQISTTTRVSHSYDYDRIRGTVGVRLTY